MISPIEKIYIPTYGRASKQKTYSVLPEKWKKKTTLVAHEKEVEELQRNYPGVHILSCPVQGPAPEGKSLKDYGAAATRNWIFELDEVKGKKFAMFDDDLNSFIWTPRPSEKTKVEKGKVLLTGDNPDLENGFDEMMELLAEWLEEFVTVGCDLTWNIPFDNDINDCWRQGGAHFFSHKFPKELIDFTVVPLAEDYYMLLTLLTNGYQNRVSMRYRIEPGMTQKEGGCASYRTIETHDESMRNLKELFPDFVTLKTGIQKGGEWAGLEKLKANIQWKKAYKSSQIQTIENFF